MPILIESDASYLFTEGEPLSAAALNAIGSPNIHTDLTAITEDDVTAVPASKLRPLHGSKIRSIQPHNLPAAEKGDLIYYDPATAEWGLLNIGDEGDFLTPLGWNSKSTPLPVSTKEVIKFQPQRGIFTLDNQSDPKELDLPLLPGKYACYIKLGLGGLAIDSDLPNLNKRNINLSIGEEPQELLGNQATVYAETFYVSELDDRSGAFYRYYKFIFQANQIFLSASFSGDASLKLKMQGLPTDAGKQTFGVTGQKSYPITKDDIPAGSRIVEGVSRLFDIQPDATGLTLTLIRISDN